MNPPWGESSPTSSSSSPASASATPRRASGAGFPLVLGLGALVKYGPDASVLLRLVVALLITVAGVILGTLIDARGREGGEHPRYA
jgi:hypothetical protein